MENLKKIKSQTKDGQKMEKKTKKGLDGFSLMFANAINYDKLADRPPKSYNI